MIHKVLAHIYALPRFLKLAAGEFVIVLLGLLFFSSPPRIPIPVAATAPVAVVARTAPSPTSATGTPSPARPPSPSPAAQSTAAQGVQGVVLGPMMLPSPPDLNRAAAAEIVGLFLQGFAADVGVEIRSVDAALLIDLVHRREQVAGYGVREVVRLVESAVVDGLLDARERGYAAASITIDGDQVMVAGVA